MSDYVSNPQRINCFQSWETGDKITNRHLFMASEDIGILGSSENKGAYGQVHIDHNRNTATKITNFYTTTHDALINSAINQILGSQQQGILTDSQVTQLSSLLSENILIAKSIKTEDPESNALLRLLIEHQTYTKAKVFFQDPPIQFIINNDLIQFQLVLPKLEPLPKNFVMTNEDAQILAMQIDHLHKLGFAHRDIRKDNIMRTSDGIIILIDLGGVLDPSLTVFAGIMNKVTTDPLQLLHYTCSVRPYIDYANPESIKNAREILRNSQDIYTRSDVYSFVICFMELTYGCRPWLHADTTKPKHVIEYLSGIKDKTIPIDSDPLQFVFDKSIIDTANISPHQVRILRNALSLSDVSSRYQSCTDFLNAFYGTEA